MNWTDELNDENFSGVVEKLKKHGYFGDVVFEALFGAYCAVMFLVNDWDIWHLIVALASVAIIARTLELTYTKERAEKIEINAMDLADELVVKEHEVERLQQELEACKEAQRKPAEKKPFSKRKPKPHTEDKNENHLD